MLLLIFHLGDDRYAIESKDVIEITPFVRLKQLPGAPAFVAGLLHFRGTIVPIIDLCQLTQNRPSEDKYSTRIIVVHYPSVEKRQHILGLIAERVTETIDKPAEDFVEHGMRLPEVSFYGGSSHDEQGILQCIRIEELIPAGMRKSLFAQTEFQA